MCKKILFVDDEPINLLLIESYLSEHISLETVDSAQGALTVMQNESANYFMVVTDLKMPLMDGLELSLALQKKYPHIRRLLYTAYFEDDNIKQYLSEGILEKVYQKSGDMESFKNDFLSYISH